MSSMTATFQALSAQALTATGQTGTFPVEVHREVTVYINVTAASGTTPSMTCTLQASPDGGTTWFDVLAGSAITGTTPSFTTSLWIEAKRAAN